MIASAQELTDVFQRCLRQFFGQVHDNLPREDDFGILFL